jgi:hypothetical protein
MIRYYMDENVHGAISRELRRRGIEVLTVFEDGRGEADDAEVLDRAMELEPVLFTNDDDLLGEAVKRQRSGEPFAGVIYAHQLVVPIGQCIADLELIAFVCEPEEFADLIRYLPLR